MRMAMTKAANDSLPIVGIRDSGFGIRESGFGIRDSGLGIRESNPISRIPDPGPRSVIYSWTVDYAVGLLFAMEELAC